MRVTSTTFSQPVLSCKCTLSQTAQLQHAPAYNNPQQPEPGHAQHTGAPDGLAVSGHDVLPVGVHDTVALRAAELVL